MTKSKAFQSGGMLLPESDFVPVDERDFAFRCRWEKLLEKLALTDEEAFDDPQVLAWAKANKSQYYVPSTFLAYHKLKVHDDDVFFASVAAEDGDFYRGIE